MNQTNTIPCPHCAANVAIPKGQRPLFASGPKQPSMGDFGVCMECEGSFIYGGEGIAPVELDEACLQPAEWIQLLMVRAGLRLAKSTYQARMN